jgi:hypothetical protein
MLLYAVINILLFFGVFSASWAGYMRQPPPSFAEYLSAFMFPGGGIALLAVFGRHRVGLPVIGRLWR